MDDYNISELYKCFSCYYYHHKNGRIIWLFLQCDVINTTSLLREVGNSCRINQICAGLVNVEKPRNSFIMYTLYKPKEIHYHSLQEL